MAMVYAEWTKMRNVRLRGRGSRFGFARRVLIRGLSTRRCATAAGGLRICRSARWLRLTGQMLLFNIAYSNMQQNGQFSWLARRALLKIVNFVSMSRTQMRPVF